MMDKTEKKVEQFIRKHRMIVENDTVVTGVSGGPDSVCLLFMLCGLREKMGFRVIACHVNHGIRGKEADEDEKYVEELCRRLDVPCRIFHENVELISRKRKQSLEEAGRDVRRNAFESVCREDGGTKIATAHHRDDNAETVLLNIARGTGLQGLCGIRPSRQQWIRPLLCLSRKEIEEWLGKKRIRTCFDATNQEDEYTRNRIRHNILPALEKQINAGAAEHIHELSLQAQEVWDYIRGKTEEAWEMCAAQENTADGIVVTVSGRRMETVDPAIKKFLIRRCIREAAGRERDIESVHIAAVLELFGRQTGKRIDLPYGVKAVRTYDGIVLRRDAPGRTAGTEPVKLMVPGETYFPATGQKICCMLLEKTDDFLAKEIPQKSYTKCFDYDIIKYSLSARFRSSGDYLAIDGDGNRQKLKSYFINEKVPREVRDRTLLIADGSHIVWIPGMRMSSAYRIGDHTKRILMIKITEGQ